MILYRFREKGVVLLNSKAWHFATYSLPRLSVMNWEEEQKATFNNSSQSKKCQRYESSNRNGSDLSNKPKVKLKTPGFELITNNSNSNTFDVSLLKYYITNN